MGIWLRGVWLRLGRWYRTQRALLWGALGLGLGLRFGLRLWVGWSRLLGALGATAGLRDAARILHVVEQLLNCGSGSTDLPNLFFAEGVQQGAKLVHHVVHLSDHFWAVFPGLVFDHQMERPHEHGLKVNVAKLQHGLGS